MQFSIVLAALAATVIAAPAPQASPQAGGGTVDPNLVPQFGVQPNQNPDGSGNCDGLQGKKIPCFCPPDRNEFLQKMQQFVSQGNVFGTQFSFPTDNSLGSQQTRIATVLSTLQDFNGTKGVGCPAVSTVFGQIQQEINTQLAQKGASAVEAPILSRGLDDMIAERYERF